MKILVTGGAGFIGSHFIEQLLDKGYEVVCVDNMNDYYNPKLKEDRLKRFNDKVVFEKIDIADLPSFEDVFKKHKFDKIVHLAAQAGVRYSLSHPHVYTQTNYVGTGNVFELARKNKVKDIVFASSSSVYGESSSIPFTESDIVDSPVSIYAATKLAGEILASTYHHLYGLNITCLRFFTVYGPWGRPDMAPIKFAKNIIAGEPIDVYNNGEMKRDFTYVDDIVEGVISALNKPLGFEVVNLGYGSPVALMDFISTLEKSLGKKAVINFMPMQMGDVHITYADITKAQNLLNFNPRVSVEEGVPKFIKWYKEYYLE